MASRALPRNAPIIVGGRDTRVSIPVGGSGQTADSADGEVGPVEWLSSTAPQTWGAHQIFTHEATDYVDDPEHFGATIFPAMVPFHAQLRTAPGVLLPNDLVFKYIWTGTTSSTALPGSISIAALPDGFFFVSFGDSEDSPLVVSFPGGRAMAVIVFDAVQSKIPANGGPPIVHLHYLDWTVLAPLPNAPTVALPPTGVLELSIVADGVEYFSSDGTPASYTFIRTDFY